MAIPAATLQTAEQDLDTAIVAGDWTAARGHAIRIQAILATLPDMDKQAFSMTYDRAAIDRLLIRIDAEISAADSLANGIGVSRVEYVRPTS